MRCSSLLTMAEAQRDGDAGYVCVCVCMCVCVGTDQLQAVGEEQWQVDQFWWPQMVACRIK